MVDVIADQVRRAHAVHIPISDRPTRYSPENLAVNRDRFAPIMALAGELGITPAQLALAWLLHQGDDIFVIPGTRNTARIDENLKALFVDLDAATLQRISDLAGPGLAEGTTLI